MKTYGLLLSLAVVLTGATALAPQADGDELQQMRSSMVDAGGSSSNASSGNSSSGRSDPDHSFDDYDDDGTVGAALLMVVGSPFFFPNFFLDEPGCVRFTGYNLEYRENSFEDSDWFFHSTQFVSSARAQVEYGTDFNDMQTVGSRLQVDFARWRSTLDVSWNNYYEQTNTGTDHLAVGDANWVFRFVQHPFTVWRSGIGINWLNDTQDDIGFNFTYGVDIAFGTPQPWVWSSDLDLGKLGDTGLFRYRTTLGLQHHDGEIYTGFEYLDVGDAQIPTMLFGARYWW